jgi:hypothetical protein
MKVECRSPTEISHVELMPERNAEGAMPVAHEPMGTQSGMLSSDCLIAEGGMPGNRVYTSAQGGMPGNDGGMPEPESLSRRAALNALRSVSEGRGGVSVSTSVQSVSASVRYASVSVCVCEVLSGGAGVGKPKHLQCSYVPDAGARCLVTNC